MERKFVSVTRQCDYLRGGRRRGNILEEIEPVAVRQHNVEDHQIRQRIAAALKSLRARFCPNYLSTGQGLTANHDQHIADQGMVFNDDDLHKMLPGLKN